MISLVEIIGNIYYGRSDNTNEYKDHDGEEYRSEKFLLFDNNFRIG